MTSSVFSAQILLENLNTWVILTAMISACFCVTELVRYVIHDMLYGITPPF